MKALFDGKEAYNISFDGKSAEHLMLDGTLVWSRPNLFFTQSLTLLNVSKLKENDIAVVDSQQNGEKFRAERIFVGRKLFPRRACRRLLSDFGRITWI